MKAAKEPSDPGVELPTDTDNQDDVAAIGQVVTRARRRKEIIDLPSSLLRLRAFQNQCHSLRINVSELAACAGFHPYKCLPKLLHEHVYQGMAGHALLMHDAKLLGLRVVSDQQVWQELAQKASVATQQAMAQALRVQTGQDKLASVQAAETLRQQIAKEAKSSKRLTSQQLAMLEDGARHCIHTGFGTTWESHALDVYEKQCGWEITERNAQVRIWDFDSHGTPLGPPRSWSNSSSHEKSSASIVDVNAEIHQYENDQLSTSHSCSLGKRQRVESNIHDKDALPELTVCSSRQDNKNSNIITNMIDHESLILDSDTKDETSVVQGGSLPYFSLRGSVDGIRQELVPIPKHPNHTNEDNKSSDHVDDDDDNEFDADVTWKLHQIVVECKHRMHQLQPTPPIYEMIQATVYCLMYDTQDADLIQILRTEEGLQKKNRQSFKKSIQDKENKAINKITNYLVTETIANNDDAIKTIDREVASRTSGGRDDETSTKNASPLRMDIHPANMNDVDLHKTTTHSSNTSEESSLEMETLNESSSSNQFEISVYRISIDDELFQHRQNWHSIVLPRLRSWTEAVYSVRKDDDKRYRLLLALAEERLQVAWSILLDECPWLRDCDTSYARDVTK